ncbi:MAG: AMP-binding protein [Desertimonas sp.]
MSTGWRSVADVVGGSARLAHGLVPVRRATPRRLSRIARDISIHGLTLPGLIRVAATRSGDEVLMIDRFGPVTAAELDRWCVTVAGELTRREILVVGGKVGILCRSGRDFVVAVVASIQLGADAVVLQPNFSAPELAELLRAEDLRAIIHDEEFGDLLTAARFRGQSILADVTSPGAPSLRSMRSLPRADLARPPRRGHLVVTTAGVTGRPRPARRAGVGPRGGAPLATLVRRLELRRGAPMLVSAPLHQPFGLQFFGLAVGLGCPVISLDRFGATQTLALIDEHRVDTLVVTPVGLGQLVDALADRPAPPSLRTIVTGGGPLLASRWRRAVAAFGPIVHHVYGSAETGWCTLATPADLAAAPGTVGRVAAGIDLRLVDDDGRKVPPGAIGRLLVESPLAAAGTPDHDGLVDSGDLGHVDRAGRYFIDGRAAEVIRVDGVDVFPDAVEDVVLSDPGVTDVAVTAAPPGDKPGPVALVVAARDAAPSVDTLAAAVVAALGPAARPRSIRIVSSIPTTDTGRRRRAH